MGIYVLKYAEGTKLALNEFGVSVDAYLSKEPLVYFRKINVKIDLKLKKLDERRLNPLYEFIKNCLFIIL